MANTPDVASGFVPVEEGDKLLPLNPFSSLRYHVGMLLGVDDFETEQAYHRAKMRLHNAWLHREGVVWGLGVRLDTARGEVRVLKGLALDAAGHELHLEGDACVNVGQWFAAHRDDADLNPDKTETTGTTNTVVSVLPGLDRKSTRLNSSHMSISYAVFCLKKKKEANINFRRSFKTIPQCTMPRDGSEKSSYSLIISIH